MKILFLLLSTIFCTTLFAQEASSISIVTNESSTETATEGKSAKLYDIPDLIPKRIDGKLGFVNKFGKIVVKPQYNFGGFYYEDCNLLNSPNPKVQKFGTDKYASVTLGDDDFRIDKLGKRVYKFNQEDLGKCERDFVPRKFYAYTYRGFFGLVNDRNFSTPNIASSFTIYPQYDYLFVMESGDPDNPMLIVARNNKFGIVNKYNEVILPLEYADIKRNFSWKIAHMFEVTKDGKNYYFVDSNNKEY